MDQNTKQPMVKQSKTPKLIWIPLTVFFAMASVSSKFAGVAWTWSLLAGLASLWITRTSSNETAKPSLANELARIWLIFTTVALVLKSIPMLYWHDPWAERHAEIRLVLGALGVYGLTRMRALSQQATHYLSLAGFTFCATGLVIILLYGRNSAPTNPIPWAAGVALVSCWLLSIFFNQEASHRGWRWLSLLASITGLMTVLVSTSRGAYGLLIVLPCMAWLLWTRRNVHKTTQKTKRTWSIIAVCALLVSITFWSLKNTPLIQLPASAIAVAAQEFKNSQSSLSNNYNTSVGARLYLWTRSADAIAKSPWIGYGHDQRKELLKQWAHDTPLSNPFVYGHVHNDYLQTLLDHGLWGLASFLTYAVGLMVLIRRLAQRQCKTTAVALFGMLLMHLTTALSNTNFAHNYYPTMLSLMIGITLWSSSVSETTKAP